MYKTMEQTLGYLVFPYINLTEAEGCVHFAYSYSHSDISLEFLALDPNYVIEATGLIQEK